MNKKMKFTNFLHPNRTEEKQVKTVERIAVIGHSTEAVGWKPVPYIFPEQWNTFQNNFSQEIHKFISSGKPDIYNAHFFDEMIDRQVQIALCHLEEQKYQHARSIHNIRIFQDSCKEDMEHRLLQLQKNLCEIQKTKAPMNLDLPNGFMECNTEKHQNIPTIQKNSGKGSEEFAYE